MTAAESLLLTFDAAAEMLAVSPRTVWSYVKRGVLPVVRMGRAVRIDRRDLLAFIDRMKDSNGIDSH